MDALDDHTDSASLDAALIVRQVLGLSRTGLYLAYERALQPVQVAAIDALVARRVAGEPMAYLLGTRAFRTIDLLVDERVLVPRPETEWFVDAALEWLAAHSGPRRVIDVGTGSGAIALALAAELPADRTDMTILASDVSAEAIEVAQSNAQRLGLAERVQCVVADLLEGIDGPFDLILANLPYLRNDQQHPSIRREPDVALYGGEDGFDHYRRLLTQITNGNLLTPGGRLIGEIDPQQTPVAHAVLDSHPALTLRVVPDLAGLDRYLVITSTPHR